MSTGRLAALQSDVRAAPSAAGQRHMTPGQDTESLRKRLAADLASKGAIRSEVWRRVFERVPRHAFIPRCYRGLSHWSEEMEHLDGEDPAQRTVWLEAVYSDQGLVIRLDEHGAPCSSSSMPIVMAQMLEALDVHDGCAVLEIGTGSGYNAALLSERLGAQHVTTVDYQPELVAEARNHLDDAGYAATAVVADGCGGYAPRAPYDRVLGTCLAWPVPWAWIEQTRPGGRVVAVVPSGLAMLTVGADGAASGPLHQSTFNFQYMQGHSPNRPPDSELRELVKRGAPRPSRHTARIIEAGGNPQSSFYVLVGMAAMPFDVILAVGEEGRRETAYIDLTDLSWARFNWRAAEVVQGGKRRLWEQIESLFDQWCQLGAPNRERFGLTVEPGGRHVLWLDEPDSEHRWDVTPSRR
jgi:protein-L-isoaspartate(D-aspartate) O-methyltransferase